MKDMEICMRCNYWRPYTISNYAEKHFTHLFGEADGICLNALSEKESTDRCAHFVKYSRRWQTFRFQSYKNDYSLKTFKKLTDLSNYYPTNPKSSKYCGFCSYWREDITEDRNRPSVIIGNKKSDYAVFFMGGLSGFCTKSGEKCNSGNVKEYCHDFFIGEVNPTQFDTEHFIPLISPRQRLMKSVRIIRSYLYWQMFYIYSVMEEVRALKTSETELQKELIADMERKIRMPSIHFDINEQVPELTQSVFNLITDVKADYFLNKVSAYNDDIMWDFCERSTMPLQTAYCYDSVYGTGKIKDHIGRLFSIEDLLDLYVEINYDAFAEMYSYTAEKVFPDNNNNVKVAFIPDEKYVYCMSVLLKLCSAEELDFLYSDIEKNIYKRDGVSTNRNYDKRDSLADRLNYTRGKTSYRNISIVTGIPEKKLSKMYSDKSEYFCEIKEKDKHTVRQLTPMQKKRLWQIASNKKNPTMIYKRKHFQELSTLCFAAGIPISDIINGMPPQKVMNPFEHLDDATSKMESRRLTLLLNRIFYIEGILAFMYKVNREFTINIIKWYKKFGLDQMDKLIEYIQRYLKKNHTEQFDMYCGDSFDC
ncbi:MAG: hypothetical protein K6A23_10205 [Butyrivibrio sp.]|nr:hypothetical protein [Butyrivibrio sp.]